MNVRAARSLVSDGLLTPPAGISKEDFIGALVRGEIGILSTTDIEGMLRLLMARNYLDGGSMSPAEMVEEIKLSASCLRLVSLDQERGPDDLAMQLGDWLSRLAETGWAGVIAADDVVGGDVVVVGMPTDPLALVAWLEDQLGEAKKAARKAAKATRKERKATKKAKKAADAARSAIARNDAERSADTD